MSYCKKEERLMGAGELHNYMKSLNPKDSEKAILIYGSSYHLWRDDEYLGVAIWTKDDNVGDSFQVGVVGTGGKLIQQVYIADKWELKIN